MYEIRVSSNTLDGLRDELTKTYYALCPNTIKPAEGENEALTPRKPRAKKAETPPTAVVEPAIEELKVQHTSTETAAPKAATQKDLLAAFRAMANAKGTDPVVALLAKYGAKSVALIPEAKWPFAIDDAQKASGLDGAAWAKAIAAVLAK